MEDLIAVCKVKVTQLCLTLCDPMEYTVHGILQARILEWVAYPFSKGSSWPRNWTGVSCIADGFFANWAIRETPSLVNQLLQKASWEAYSVFVVVQSLSHIWLFATPWTVAYQAPQYMGFSRQEYWSGLPFLSLGDLPDPGIESGSPALQTDSLPSEQPGKPLVIY